MQVDFTLPGMARNTDNLKADIRGQQRKDDYLHGKAIYAIKWN